MPTARTILLVAQPEVIYAHARSLTSGFLTNFVHNAVKCWFTAEMFMSYRKSGTLNPFPVTNLESQVELMY